ncbi:MAG: hypothetical protein ACKV22_00175, partial [Bryobacteraceae bacterium]
MRFLVLGLLLASPHLHAQTTAGAPAAAGTPVVAPGGSSDGLVPRRLRKAEDDLNDLRDGLILQATLYSGVSSDLTEEKCVEMVEAARRRVSRREAEVSWTKELVELGALARIRLQEPQQKLEWAQKEQELALNRQVLVKELAELVRAEQVAATEPPTPTGPLAERFDGRRFRFGDIVRVEQAFAARFLKALPVSARGDTALHRALGFDHRDRMDVAVHPDDPEGVWLRNYLRE